MAQVLTRVNLASQAFPFLSEFSGRSIIVKQTDQNYIALITSKEDLDHDVGVPTLYYCHNVVATSQGYQAVEYLATIGAIPNMLDFADLFITVDSATSGKAYIGYTTAGNFYVSKDPDYQWTFVENIPPAAGKQITSAYVNGITYFYVENVGCYKYNFTTNTFDIVTLAGLVTETILGIVAVQGYLLAWSKDAIAWSSLVDPTDFVPSLTTGAGGGSVQGAKGDIVACVSHTIGLVIYTNQNAVAAPTSGNARYPFNFRELVASGGLADIEKVTYDANSGNHYAYTTSGLQLISLQQAQTIIPEVTDFLAGAVFEDFDDTTREFVITKLDTTMQKRLTLVSDRYLIFSYGITEFTHALIYDLSLKRWSKLKYTHVKVFEYSLLKAETVETPRRSIALLDKTGAVKVVKLDVANISANGTALLGKYQIIRNRLSELQAVDIENIPEGVQFTLTDMYCLDGKNYLYQEGYLQKSAGDFRRYLFHAAAINHSLLLQGAFNIVSMVITMNNHGRR